MGWLYTAIKETKDDEVDFSLSDFEFDVEEPQTWYFTFGQDHVHPKTGEPLKDYWVEIVGTFYNARNAMFTRYGAKWCAQYDAKSIEQHHYPKGCYERIEDV